MIKSASEFTRSHEIESIVAWRHFEYLFTADVVARWNFGNLCQYCPGNPHGGWVGLTTGEIYFLAIVLYLFIYLFGEKCRCSGE